MTRRNTSSANKVLLVAIVVSLVALARLVSFAARGQVDVSDAELERANAGRTITIGALSGDRTISRVPLEVYVARVLTGEAEQNAPDGELQALAIAIRTYATFNAGRHARDGFDLCDTTHCQVMRAATAATRRAALATAGQILTWNGAPAEIFYSASCGGRSETASAVWPGANLPYLKSVKDDVHDDDEPWTFELPLRDAERLLAQKGFAGERLKDVRVVSHTSSGRVASLRLSGLEPDVIAGDQFRLLVGARELKSTAFTVEKHGDRLDFMGRGYGHGVGMCVIGAGRRARRGETVRQILAQYYPGLELMPLESVPGRTKPDTLIAVDGPTAGELRAPRPESPAVGSRVTTPVVPLATPSVTPVLSPPAVKSPVTVHGSAAGASELQQIAGRAHDAMVKVLGSNVAPVTIDVHETVEGFRQATGKPWWVSASVNGTVVDLAPPSLLAQRDGVETTLRNAIAQAIMSPDLSGRPEWVRVGAARYFSRPTPPPPPDRKTKLKCPADAELTLAISATAQREAESRAESCFARAYSTARDWRAVR